jgi:lysozyme family protein
MSEIEIENPFPGLRPFREEEEHLFFGRESQVNAMVDKLSAARFLAVVGTSGSGKSSLVNCGLRPALHRGLMTGAGTSWRMVQFRPGGRPLTAMIRALSTDGALYSGYHGAISLEEIIDTPLRLSKRGLIDTFRKARLPDGVNLLVVVDQFEELFRYQMLDASAADRGQTRSQEGVAFVNLLLEAGRQVDFPIYIVLTMRSDFLGNCAEFSGLPEAINAGQYLVPRMTREERRAAIKRPVGVGGAEISPVLLTRLVNDVGDNPDQLSILQHALNRTWSRWQHEGRAQGPLDLPHYEAIGTMAHALDQHAEKAYEELGNERAKKSCEKIFKALTDKGTDPRGIRRPTEFSTLCALANASPAEVSQVIDVFRKPSRSFLMPPLPEVLEPDTVIDISHESLMRVWERLKVWADEEAQSAQLYRRLSETAALYVAGKAGPWRDPDLQLALDWRKKEEPSVTWAGLYRGGFEPAMAFLGESEALREKEIREKEEHQKRELDYEKALALADEQKLRLAIQIKSARRMRLAMTAVTILFVGALFASYWAWYNAQAAIYQQEIAERNEVDARNYAAMANYQQKIAEESEKVAQVSARRAANEAKRADAERKIADQQRLIAVQAMTKAEAERRKAVAAREEAETQREAAEKARNEVIELSKTNALFARLLRLDYEQLFAQTTIRPEDLKRVDFWVKQLIHNKARYETVSAEFGIPWYMIGVIHVAEAGLNFNAHLHNGDPLTNKTIHNPAGRPPTGSPPFTWEESAIDFLRLTGLDKWKDWSIPGVLVQWEQLNGLGYRRLGMRTPYVWACTNMYSKGKFVADGRFDPEAVAKWCGGAAILRRMFDLGIMEAPS